MLNRQNLLILAALVITSIFASNVQAGERVQVTTDSGRVFVGCVHQSSSDNVLQLEAAGAASHIVRPIAWSAIRSITIESSKQQLSSNAAKQLRNKLAAAKGATRIVKPASSLHRSYAEQALDLLGFNAASNR